MFNEPSKTRRFMAAGELKVVYSFAEVIALTTHNFYSLDQEVKLLRAPINSLDRKRIVQPPESKNHIFSVWSVCVCVISITQKQITAETSNFVFYICIAYRCY